jgi:hypothetical protein
MTFHRPPIALLHSISSGLSIDCSSFEVKRHGSGEYSDWPLQEDKHRRVPSGCNAQHDLAALMRLTEHFVCCAGLFQGEYAPYVRREFSAVE